MKNSLTVSASSSTVGHCEQDVMTSRELRNWLPIRWSLSPRKRTDECVMEPNFLWILCIKQGCGKRKKILLSMFSAALPTKSAETPEKAFKRHLPERVWRTRGTCKQQRSHLCLTTSGWHGNAKHLPHCHRQQAGMLPEWQRGRAKGAERPESLGSSLRHLHLDWNTHEARANELQSNMFYASLSLHWRTKVNTHTHVHPRAASKQPGISFLCLPHCRQFCCSIYRALIYCSALAQ